MAYTFIFLTVRESSLIPELTKPLIISRAAKINRAFSPKFQLRCERCEIGHEFFNSAVLEKVVFCCFLLFFDFFGQDLFICYLHCFYALLIWRFTILAVCLMTWNRSQSKIPRYRISNISKIQSALRICHCSWWPKIESFFLIGCELSLCASEYRDL